MPVTLRDSPRRQRERDETDVLMSRTTILHVHLKNVLVTKSSYAR